MPHYMLPSNERYWNFVQEARRFLTNVFPEITTTNGYVAVTGSAALHWYQDRYHCGHDWYKPYNIDVVVCGKSKEGFEDFMDSVSIALAADGFLGSWTKARKTFWIMLPPVHVVNWLFQSETNRNHALSFTWSPFDTVRETVRHFDLDICQVMYHLHTDTFHTLDRSVERNIRNSEALLTCTTFPLDRYLTKHQLCSVTSTLQRILKYTQRNFTVTNAAVLTFTAPMVPHDGAEIETLVQDVCPCDTQGMPVPFLREPPLLISDRELALSPGPLLQQAGHAQSKATQPDPDYPPYAEEEGPTLDSSVNVPCETLVEDVRRCETYRMPGPFLRETPLLIPDRELALSPGPLLQQAGHAQSEATQPDPYYPSYAEEGGPTSDSSVDVPCEASLAGRTSQEGPSSSDGSDSDGAIVSGTFHRMSGNKRTRQS